MADTDENERFTLTDTDHQAIADRLFEKASQGSKDDNKDEDNKDKPSITLSDDDRKGIAAHLRQLDKDEAEAAAKAENEKNQQKKEQKENTPSAPKNVFEKALFSIGGGK